MSQAPHLLNDDGSASMATALMMSHHGFRRDLARFAGALSKPALEPGKVQALKEEWQSFHATLHGHHEAEDNGMFPSMRTQSDALAKTIDKLGADHRLIDPLLERGDAAFAELSGETSKALAIARELQALLGPHLALEESELIPLLREAKAFPPPPDEAAADTYAKGFAWAMHGIAPGVLEQVYKMLPPVLKEKLPAARAEFDARCDRVWGPLPPLASRTPIPE
jgi:hypothetical protein